MPKKAEKKESTEATTKDPVDVQVVTEDTTEVT